MKVVITGAECSGKTSLALNLAKYYDTSVVSEYARVYLSNKPNREYDRDDLVEIAKGQLTKEKLVERRGLIICDTSILVIYLWSKIRFGSVDPAIKEMLDNQHVDLYILPYWDIPYEADPLRENEGDRKEIFETYLAELRKRHLPYMVVSGSKERRLELSRQTIDTFKKYEKK